MTCSLWKEAFPDNQSRVTSTYVEGDTVVQQAVFEGTHTGTFNAPEQAPIEATNKKLALRHVNICTVRNGKVKSWALYFDRADLMDQLGAGG
jgi:predicted ester cyclase